MEDSSNFPRGNQLSAAESAAVGARAAASNLARSVSKSSRNRSAHTLGPCYSTGEPPDASRNPIIKSLPLTQALHCFQLTIFSVSRAELRTEPCRKNITSRHFEVMVFENLGEQIVCSVFNETDLRIRPYLFIDLWEQIICL